MMTEFTYKKAGVSSYGISKVVSTHELILMYIGVPLALLFVYLLPFGIKTQFFTLHLDHPMILTLLTSAFNHDLYSHFAANVFYYAIVLSAILVIETNLRRFQYMALVMFTAVPILSSVATIVYFAGSGFGQMLGFSGIVSGFLGYLIYLIIEKMYQVTPITKPHALFTWASISILIVFSAALSIGAVSLYQVGHLSNGGGHLVGYLAGLVLAYTLRTL